MGKIAYDLRFLFRNPRTTKEKRDVEAAIEQGVPVRGKRAASNLPDTYDDIWVHREKSWKHKTKRRKQYIEE